MKMYFIRLIRNMCFPQTGNYLERLHHKKTLGGKCHKGPFGKGAGVQLGRELATDCGRKAHRAGSSLVTRSQESSLSRY